MRALSLKSTRHSELAGLILFMAVLLGAFMRFNAPLLAGQAVSDGGMFAVMVDDLKASHYVLPAFTTYNHSNIPFAYPPIGFYAGRLAADLFGLTAPQALRWIPALIASLSIPAFYLLSLRLLKNKYQAAVATLFFALMPRAFSWFVSGGGLTRSPGQLFLLLTLASTVRLYEENRRGEVFWTGLFAGLTVMSHPEAAVHMVASVIFFWIMLGRSRTTFFRLVGVGVIALIVSAPWWLTVIHYHGLGPLLSAAQTGQKSAAILNLVFFDFAEEPYATLITVLALIGLGQRLVRKDYLLPLWLALPFLVEGRSAALPAAIPLAMLAAIGLTDIVSPGLLSLVKKEPDRSDEVSAVEFGVITYLLAFLIFSCYQFGFQLSGKVLSIPAREAMQWIKTHTPEDAKFLVLTGTNAITCDLTLEWFPALTGRQSLLTVQGAEWTQGRNFRTYVQSTYPVQECLSSGDLSCLDGQISRSAYNFVYISKVPYVNCAPVDLPNSFSHFIGSIGMAPDFGVVYETDEVIIFGKRELAWRP
jgi:hypothetical protein